MTAIHQARFNRYLEDRGLVSTANSRVWYTMGDGESDEPESLSQLSLAGREGLDNIVMTMNCNLQRLDGPVRGNSKIVQELEGRFRGAGWNVIKVLWGSSWDDLFARDNTGALAARLDEFVDGCLGVSSMEFEEIMATNICAQINQLLITEVRYERLKLF